ncbi:hypothetical protein FLAG1_11574 [Fusarium langsethiae]|uniref:Uncharacterized protein n=1 Tax=Fusarium langsethiae TaxID=179993 RepID=A0A0M9ELV5_FUSLA|nr:hypothetical protein FLAG1_11574 [Fusarium langsethiae]GKU12108.1 unnamed protein product [Fusarium langsethiae]
MATVTRKGHCRLLLTTGENVGTGVFTFKSHYHSNMTQVEYIACKFDRGFVTRYQSDEGYAFLTNTFRETDYTTFEQVVEDASSHEKVLLGTYQSTGRHWWDHTYIDLLLGSQLNLPQQMVRFSVIVPASDGWHERRWRAVPRTEHPLINAEYVEAIVTHSGGTLFMRLWRAVGNPNRLFHAALNNKGNITEKNMDDALEPFQSFFKFHDREELPFRRYTHEMGLTM